MLADAIFQKVLRLPPEVILRWICFTIFLVGLLGNVAVSAFFQIMENTPKAKARRALDLNEELQRKYEGVCAQLVEERTAREKADAELVNLRRLNAERIQFDRYHDSRTKAAMTGRKQ